LGVPGREAEIVGAAAAATDALGAGDALESSDALGDGLGRTVSDGWEPFPITV
jgi:hypothetical protein